MPNKKQLDKECLFLCKKIIMLRASGMCECGCGRIANDPSHVINRDRLATRYDIDNIVALNRYCHNHDLPVELKERHIRIIGQKKYDELRLRGESREHKQWRLTDLIELKQQLTEMLRGLEGK